MLTLTRQTRMDKAKETLGDVVAYADEVIRDERLRKDLLAAIGHGAEAGEQARTSIDADGVTARLAEDKELHKKLRVTLEDLEHAAARLRRKRSHRVRNVVLVAAIAGAAAVVVANARRWFAQGVVEPTSQAMAPEVVV